MTDDEVGKYIRLLCFQHQSGHFSKEAMEQICRGNAPASVLSKFKIDENGLYYNCRLDLEKEKRKESAEFQRQRALKRWHQSGNAGALPLEDENANEDRNLNAIVIKKGVKGEVKYTQDFETFWALWTAEVDRAARGKKPAFEKAWMRLPGDFNLQAILDGVRRYGKFILDRHIEPDKVKMAQGWLNDRRWEDAYITKRPEYKVSQEVIDATR